MRLYRVLSFAALLTAGAFAVSFADPPAGDRILTFGGGPVPQHSQASLEQNVLYLRRVLKELNLGALRHDVYFTDGAAGSRTVEVRPPGGSELRPLISSLFNENSDAVQTQFRPSQIPELAGPSTPDAIAGWFDANAKTLHPKDHLLVYFTGHGEPLYPERPRRNPNAPAPILGPGTRLDTWNHTSITTKDFVGFLDKLDPDVDVTLVMVQCFSGGFANVIYNAGDPAKGISKAHRCGFFSTIPTRPAAGCTMDIEGDDYQEFSTAFFAALSGKTRNGKAVERPDYNKDGVTSFNEAFTYVLLTSNTIDIPMTTSDQLLRDKSRFGATRPADAKLLPRDAPYAALLAAASPAQKAALDGLSAILNLTGENRATAARALAIDIERDRLTYQKTMSDAQQDLIRLSAQIRPTIESRWPELAVHLHPDAEAVFARDGKQIQAAIEAHPSFAAWKAAREKWFAAYDKDTTLERKWVKTQRFIARCETVALAANLEAVAPADVVQCYKELLTLESQSFAAFHAN